MNRKNELYVGIGDYYPYMLYAHLIVGPFDNNYKDLYEAVNKYKEKPIIFIFDMYCTFLNDDDIIVDKYDFICLCRDCEMYNPNNDDVEKTIKDILTYESWTDTIVYNNEEKLFYIIEDNILRNITLVLLRSLKNPNNIRVINV